MSEFKLDKKLIQNFESSRSNIDGVKHYCYLLNVPNSKKCYVGYTVDPERRLRQHNGEIKGGAKKTSRHNNWNIVCTISGFDNYQQALRFEWKWQHIKFRFFKNITFKTKPNGRNEYLYIKKLYYTINCGDKGVNWPDLEITWYVNPIPMFN